MNGSEFRKNSPHMNLCQSFVSPNRTRIECDARLKDSKITDLITRHCLIPTNLGLILDCIIAVLLGITLVALFVSLFILTS